MENIFYSTGRRKESTARVFLSKGTGKITVNSNPIEKYFGRKTNIMVVKQALNLTETADKTDIKVTVKGGGSSGQAGAIKLGIARALLKIDGEFTNAKIYDLKGKLIMESSESVIDVAP